MAPAVDAPPLDDLSLDDLSLDDLLGRFETADLLDLPASVVAGAITALEQARARLDRVSSRVIHRFDADGRAVLDGQRTTRAWLAQHTQMAGVTAGRRVKVARALRTLPVVAAAFDEGKLSFEQVYAFAAAVNARTEDAMRVDEEALVGMALGLRVDDLVKELAMWQDTVDVDGAEPDPGHPHRNLTLAQSLGGRWFGTIELGQADGAVAKTAIEHVSEYLYRQEKSCPDVARTPGQRRADALMELVRRGVATFDADTHAPGHASRPSVTLLIPLEDLQARRPARTDRGDLVNAAGYGRLMCDCDVNPIGWSVDGVPLSHGRTRRFPTPAQRRAAIAQHGGCAFPGCDAPATWADIHHVEHWERDHGTTDQDNLVPCCAGTHHPLFHEGGWSMTITADGIVTIHRPDGTIYDPTPGWN